MFVGKEERNIFFFRHENPLGLYLGKLNLFVLILKKLILRVV